MTSSVLDSFFASFALTCTVEPVEVETGELVHVIGTQEPVRDQPDERARTLLNAGWLKIESIELHLNEDERADLVVQIQHAARNWLKQAAKSAGTSERDQVRWLVEKTRGHESKQQIVQRVWLAAVLYCLGYRNLQFDAEGQIAYEGGVSGRIGLAPDAVIDIAWSQPGHQVYVASFRHPDGTVLRGKGRHRWYVYRLTIAPDAAFLFERRTTRVHESIALIVASESHATRPQLPRNFYGGNEFQQACIDAQDGGFTHMLVLSPEHGVISLDDPVPSDRLWDFVLDNRVWRWQILAVERLGACLFGPLPPGFQPDSEMSLWPWLNPESRYDLTVFGGGFAVTMLLDFLRRARARRPENWPDLVLLEQRPGYHTGELDDDLDYEPDYGFDEGFEDEGGPEGEMGALSIQQLLDWSTELAQLITIYVPPTEETWNIGPDEALIPVRLLADSEMNLDDLLELLGDMSLLLDQQVPLGIVVNAPMVVSALIQITHSLVHDERDAVLDLLKDIPEPVLHHYIETVLQEPSREEQLCACLTLAEQLQLLSMALPTSVKDQLMVWLQTYISARLRSEMLKDYDEP